MSEMVERVARTLAKIDGFDPDEDPNYVDGKIYTQVAHPPGTRLWNRYERKARAAIAAMREPTKAMHDAGSHGYNDALATVIWQAMIDEALK